MAACGVCETLAAADCACAGRPRSRAAAALAGFFLGLAALHLTADDPSAAAVFGAVGLFLLRGRV